MWALPDESEACLIECVEEALSLTMSSGSARTKTKQ